MACNPIQAARLARGLTRDELGSLVGVSGRTVSYWESWRKLPGETHAQSIKRVLGLSDGDVWRATHASRRSKADPIRRKIW